MTTQASAEHVRRLPKAELHCHVEGCARTSTIQELATKNGVELPVDDPRDLYKFTSLTHFLEILTVVVRCLRTADDYRRITYEALEDAVSAGVRYREMFFSPKFAMQFGVPFDTIWQGIRDGLIDARADFDINARMILEFDKQLGVAHTIEMAEFAASEPDRDLLVGIGAESEEVGVDHRIFIPAFDLARRNGLRTTMHAGEEGPAENIRVAINECGCERIDHGFHLVDDPDLTRQVADAGIPVTVCPSSNRAIGLVDEIAAHPFDQMRRAGVLVSVNTDDPGMMGFDLADEYHTVATAFDYDLDDMESLSLAGVASSWASDDEKRAMRGSFISEFGVLRTEYGLPTRSAGYD
jgi:adenosine deaminase